MVIYEDFALTNVDFCIPCVEDVATDERRQFLLAPDDATSTTVTTATTQHLEEIEAHRELWLRFNFRWGMQARWQCTYCYGDTKDARKRNLRGLVVSNEDLRKYLVGALETVITFGLSMDLMWEVQAFLAQRGLEYGCFGNGEDLSVVFELI